MLGTIFGNLKRKEDPDISDSVSFPPRRCPCSPSIGFIAARFGRTVRLGREFPLNRLLRRMRFASRKVDGKYICLRTGHDSIARELLISFLLKDRRKLYLITTLANTVLSSSTMTRHRVSVYRLSSWKVMVCEVRYDKGRVVDRRLNRNCKHFP